MEEKVTQVPKTHKKRKLIIVLTLFIVIVAGFVLTYFKFMKHTPVISPFIKSQVSTPIFLPSQKDYKVDPQSVTFDTREKLLTFTATNIGDGSTVVVTQQPTPDTFTDIPQYFDKLVEAMGQYKQFDSLNGKVTLTKPTELKGSQTAVLNQNGTLLFARPSRDLTDDDWRRFFNGLVLNK